MYIRNLVARKKERRGSRRCGIWLCPMNSSRATGKRGGAVESWEVGSGFRVQGSGFRVQGSGFRVQGSGLDRKSVV